MHLVQTMAYSHQALGDLSLFLAQEQDRVSGRVRLVYVPDFVGNPEQAGKTLGCVNAADLEVQEPRNCQ